LLLCLYYFFQGKRKKQKKEKKEKEVEDKDEKLEKEERKELSNKEKENNNENNISNTTSKNYSVNNNSKNNNSANNTSNNNKENVEEHISSQPSPDLTKCFICNQVVDATHACDICGRHNHLAIICKGIITIGEEGHSQISRCPTCQKNCHSGFSTGIKF